MVACSPMDADRAAAPAIVAGGPEEDMARRRWSAPRRALVTGASSGLGRAIALELAARGCEVWLAARRVGELESAAAAIRARGGRAVARELDVRDAERVVACVRDWDRECGGFDLVLANAGIGTGRRRGVHDPAAEQELWRVNLVGAAATLCGALEPMLARGHGTLAAVTSLAGRRGMPGSGAYAASKAALTAYLESLRCEVEPRGLHVVELRPGYVHTALTAQNDFAMPFAWPVERAAAVCVDALCARRRVRAFPWQLVLATSVLRVLPTGLYTRLARGLPGSKRSADALPAPEAGA
ncbi:MAG: SDR family NAD(P)-dependent oxidoreductase [Planctomycetota bacterium]|nr:MAG: SDR family NAD(P)-dependent oxidoreductase [Planctomycetota bacterium]